MQEIYKPLFLELIQIMNDLSELCQGLNNREPNLKGMLNDNLKED